MATTRTVRVVATQGNRREPENLVYFTDGHAEEIRALWREKHPELQSTLEGFIRRMLMLREEDQGAHDNDGG